MLTVCQSPSEVILKALSESGGQRLPAKAEGDGRKAMGDGRWALGGGAKNLYLVENRQMMLQLLLVPFSPHPLPCTCMR